MRPKKIVLPSRADSALSGTASTVRPSRYSTRVPLVDGVWVTDLHSTNGTRVEYRDGRSVEAVPDMALSALEGSTIYFGRIAFKVEVV